MGRARLGLQPGLVPALGFTPRSKPRPRRHASGPRQLRHRRRAAEQRRRGLRSPGSSRVTYAEDLRCSWRTPRAVRKARPPPAPQQGVARRGRLTRCPRGPGSPCFFTCSRRRSFMAGSSARSEGTSPSLFTTATLAPRLRKYLWGRGRGRGQRSPCRPGTSSRVRTRGSTQSEAWLGRRVPQLRSSAQCPAHWPRQPGPECRHTASSHTQTPGPACSAPGRAGTAQTAHHAALGTRPNPELQTWLLARQH